MTATAIKCRPIIFVAESIRAIYAGRKTQARWVVKPQPEREDTFWMGKGGWFGVDETTKTRGPCLKCPYGQPGDRLWVRETWGLGTVNIAGSGRNLPRELFRADGDSPPPMGWRSPMHMPRAMSRLTLEVTAVRVERLQDISDDDVFAEFPPGMVCARYQCRRCNGQGRNLTWPRKCPHCDGTGDAPAAYFADDWNSLNAKRGFPWDSNPWVWVVEFQRAEDAS